MHRMHIDAIVSLFVHCYKSSLFTTIYSMIATSMCRSVPPNDPLSLHTRVHASTMSADTVRH